MTKPLFIVGAGRSGTKFLMNILNNSPFVHLAPEIHFFSSLIHAGFRKNLRKACGTKKQYGVGEILECLCRPDNFGTYWRRQNEFSERGLREWFQDKPTEDRNIYQFIIQHDYLRRVSGKPRLKYLGEKTPSNIFHVGEILGWFADATVLFIYRSPLDVLKSEVNKGHKPDYPLKKSNPLYAYGLVAYVFLEWLLAAVLALAHRHRCPNNVVFISYDFMNHDVQGVIRRVAGILDIPYAPEMCQVEKVDSSLSGDATDAVWTPPRWIAWMYGAFLSPIMMLLDRRAVHNDARYLPRSVK